MKTEKLEVIIDTRLEKIGAARIPASARRAVIENMTDAFATLVAKKVTGEFIGKMVARALSSGEGREGEDLSSPSPSQSGCKPSAQPDVACQVSASSETQDGDSNARRQEDITGGQS